MLSLLFLGWFILFYTVLGGWLILSGLRPRKRRDSAPPAGSPAAYAKLGDPPLRSFGGLSPSLTGEASRP